MTVCKEMQQLRQMLDAKKIKWIDKSEDYSKPEYKMWICRTHFKFRIFNFQCGFKKTNHRTLA